LRIQVRKIWSMLQMCHQDDWKPVNHLLKTSQGEIYFVSSIKWRNFSDVSWEVDDFFIYYFLVQVNQCTTSQVYSCPIKRIDVIVIVWIVQAVSFLVHHVNHQNVVSNVVCQSKHTSLQIEFFCSLGNLRTYAYEYRLYGTNKEILQE